MVLFQKWSALRLQPQAHNAAPACTPCYCPAGQQSTFAPRCSPAGPLTTVTYSAMQPLYADCCKELLARPWMTCQPPAGCARHPPGVGPSRNPSAASAPACPRPPRPGGPAPAPAGLCPVSCQRACNAAHACIIMHHAMPLPPRLPMPSRKFRLNRFPVALQAQQPMNGIVFFVC